MASKNGKRRQADSAPQEAGAVAQQGAPSEAPRKWRNRIVGHGEEDPEQLLANPKNYRCHPKNQQDALAGVLSTVGWVQEVIVNRVTNFVVDGHLRVAMAISAGEKVPVVYVELTEEEESLILATFDPLTGMAVKDEELFNALVGGMDDAFKALVAATAEPQAGGGAQPGEDDAPEVPLAPVSRRGDLWSLGQHRLLVGDATNAEDVARLMNGERADLVLCDPPYGIGIVKAKGSVVGGGVPGAMYPFGGKNGRGTVGASKPYGKGTVGLVKAREYYPVTGDDRPFDPAHLLALGTEQIIFGANYFASKLPDGKAWLAWDKDVSGNFSEVELAWTSREGRLRLFKYMWSGLRREGPRAEELTERVHPTQKPVGLFREIIREWGSPAIILDPYLGSGTTLIAAEVEGRRCFGIEIEPGYADIICERWQTFTGKQATLDGLGATFAQVKEGRRLEAEDAIKEEVLAEAV